MDCESVEAELAALRQRLACEGNPREKVVIRLRIAALERGLKLQTAAEDWRMTRHELPIRGGGRMRKKERY